MKKFLLCLSIFFSLFRLYGEVTWGSPVAISNAGVDAESAQVVLDTNGNATAVWVENGTIQSSFQSYGGSWGTPIPVYSTGTASDPCLDIDANGNVTLVWLDTGRVYTCLYNGSFWSTSTALSDSAGGASTPVVAVNTSGNTVVCWARNGYIESITLYNGTWGTVYMLSGSLADSPQVAISESGHAIVAWHSIVSGVDTISSSVSSVGGNWTPALNLTTSSVNAIKPRVTMDQLGNAYAAWFQYTRPLDTYSNVQVFTSSLFGNVNALTWTAPIAISDPGARNPEDLSLQIKSDAQGNVVIVWTMSYDGSTFNAESQIMHAGTSVWENYTPFVLQSYFAYMANVDVASTGNTIVASMYSDQFNTTTSSILTQNSYIPGVGTGNWTFPTYLAVGENNGFPQVAAEVSGQQLNGVILWQAYDGTNIRLQAATGYQPLISPPSNLQVTQQSTTYGIFTDYYNTLTWDPSPSPDIQGYAIYRDGLFYTQQQDLSNLQIVDHNGSPGGATSYGVAAIDNQQNQSATVTVSLPVKEKN